MENVSTSSPSSTAAPTKNAFGAKITAAAAAAASLGGHNNKDTAGARILASSNKAAATRSNQTTTTHSSSFFFDHQRLYEVTKVVVKNLNKIIDRNHYPLEEARNSNMRHRPIGLGVQGLADTFIRLRLPFESEGARALNDEIFETIYFAALTASMELAKKDGSYETYKGSPGKLHGCKMSLLSRLHTQHHLSRLCLLFPPTHSEPRTSAVRSMGQTTHLGSLGLDWFKETDRQVWST